MEKKKFFLKSNFSLVNNDRYHKRVIPTDD